MDQALPEPPKDTKKDIRAVNTNLSYFTLRKIIGWSGLLLPWLAWLIAWSYEPSISDYYYTRSGVLFIAVLTLVGAFLMSYRGYKRETEKISDNVLTWIGGILILVVAAVPTPYLGSIDACPTPICHQDDTWRYVHFGSAAAFFAIMGHLSIYRFRRGEKEITDQKRIRNRIYLICGIGMWATLAIAGVIIFLTDLDEKWTHLVLWVEIVMLTFFGVSWLVKGKGLVDLRLQKDD